MPDLLTPAIVAETLSGIGRELDTMPAVIETLDETEVRAQHAAKQAYRRAFMEAQGAMDLRKVVADDAASGLQLEADLAGVALRAARTQIAVLRDRLDVGRSLSALVRLEWSQ